MTAKTAPARDWLKALPRDRLLGEFSLWSADLANLERDVARTEPFVDLYHIDVADGRFAPSFLFFADQVARIRALTTKPLHVHLMVEGDIVLEQIRQFAEAGADLITVHAENGTVTGEALALIKQLGVEAGIVLRLETPVEALKPWLNDVAFITLLGTAIGVKGQGLSDEACPRLLAARRLLQDAGREDVRLAADGGIRETTVPKLRAAGAETVVLGSLAFGDPDLKARTGWLHGLPVAEAAQ
ncbi:ribulose-phosphate 3-epimerase [Phyllobacterium zundukense]|uniref:D-allulose-6-phosphate 3-epimerase n=1 Tax=Phyllobacterium zundukense TaxID=1867719 RepID=A0A2N9VX30_9HYPH|nr:ribulose-phosphate 3-epimerase [Phyllobacterium zundukense]ATU90308.1 D-allulose-6-phosphate 3-epimerase [Phyllobacterium zundukense]PIO44048.1 D-allulose-6-phosphate 3-epimerase [Phyllobacterium zundukense]